LLLGCIDYSGVSVQNFVRQSALTSTELQQLLGAEAPGKHVVYLTRILTKIRTAWAMKWAESKLACIVSIALVCAFFAAVIFTMVRVSHAYQTQEFALRSAIVPSTTVEFPQIVLYFLNQSSSMVINSTRAMYVQGGISLPTKPDWNYDCEKVDDAQPAVRPVFANPNGINMMHYAFNTKGLCMSDRSIRNQRYQIQYASFERAHLEQVSVIAWIGYVDSSNYDSGKPPSSKFVSDVFQESAANGAQVYFNFMQKVKYVSPNLVDIELSMKPKTHSNMHHVVVSEFNCTTQSTSI
jgi:hypothetical protein